ncbi:MAG: ATP-dependent DNA helicase PcrA [Chlamydiia bacterium]|nr:ATP-dependent DNA helicase PcrA [Chlamydiia bacterium]
MSESFLLNKEQQEAVNHIDGPLVVLAGAGSGKTSVVVSRIAHLIGMGISPNEILAVTFTNKAANELRERLRQRDITPPFTATFHALGVRILRESIHHFGYETDFIIFDASDTTSIISGIIADITGKREKKIIKEIKGLISRAKSKLLLPGAHFPSDFGFDTEADKALFLEVYKRYQESLKNANGVDFDDLIMLTVFILQEDEFRKKYSGRWKYILVDEYQDTNQAQYLICKALCSQHQNIFVVGDPDQSIYSWRGAKISNILNFEKDFDGSRVIALQQNYRSTNHILSAANHVIEKNDRLYEKHLFSDKGDGELVGVHGFSNGYDEVRFVVRKIEEYKRKQIPLEEIVIFYRTNSQSRMFEDGLIENGIPYQVIGGFSFYQRKEIKDIIAYLRTIASPFDFVSFSRVINLPKRGIGKKTIEKIIQSSVDKKASIIQILKELLNNEGSFKLTQKARDGVLSFVSFYDEIQKLIESKAQLADVIAEVYAESNYQAVLLEDKESFHDRLENIDELISKADHFDKRKSGDLKQFLEDVCLDVENKGDEYEAKISLMTIHNAKGLEFDACFVVGLEEDLFPHIRSKDSFEDVEEERRLFYVGMTRAKKFLHLTYAKRRFLWGSEKICKPSRFIHELPNEHISGGLIKPSFEEEVSGDIKEGAFVYHKAFGKGVIDRIYETSYGQTYDVLFVSDNEKRTLVAKYAKLTLVR